MGSEELKAENPGDYALASSHPVVSLYLDAVHMQHIMRRGWLARDVPPLHAETDAEHTCNVVLLSDVVRDLYYPDLDPLKTMRTAYLHELCEVHSGDPIPADGIDALTKE